YDRAEDLIATTKRHPSRVRHRTAVSKEGKLLGGEIEVVIDGGAYVTLSPVVLSRATIHSPGPYHWPFLTVRAKAIATNIAPRGVRSSQSHFAHQAGHRLCFLHARLRLHRLRRAPPQLAGQGGAHAGGSREYSRLLHRIWPGDQHHPLSGVRADASNFLRRRR